MEGHANMNSNDKMIDIPHHLLQNKINDKMIAVIKCTEDGILCGIDKVIKSALENGLEILETKFNGDCIKANDKLIVLKGNTLDIIKGEDLYLSYLCKPSGIASTGYKAKQMAGELKVVSGGWKKIPLEYKNTLREALTVSGVGLRILDEPFIYLDKNYLSVHKTIEDLICIAKTIPSRRIAIQIKGNTDSIEGEALKAAELGVSVIMIDTGNIEDINKCSAILRENKLRHNLQLAYAGGICLNDIEKIRNLDVDLIDVGRTIIDAPLLDIRYNVYWEEDYYAKFAGKN